MKQVCGIWFPESDTHFKLGMIDKEGNYQKDTFDAAISYVKEPKIFYDIGAHVGLWSLMAIRAGFKEIHAFEPNPITFGCLKKNLDGRGGDYKAHLYNYGVSNSDGFACIVEEDGTNSGAVRLRYGVHAQSDNMVEILPIRFRNAASTHSHECLVKIDTEGTENDCIEGMREVLYALRPVICVEQRTNKDALDILQQMGMEIVQQIRKDYILTWKNQ